MQALQQRQIGQDRSINIDFESWLYNWACYIRDQQAAQRSLTEACVTLHVRARCLTVSDMVSGFGTRANTQGQWLNYDPTLDGESHPINIVGPAFTTNKNACLQSNSQTEVTPANQSAQHKQIAQRWQRVADYFERTGWNEAKRGYIFDDVQKGGTILIDTFCKEYDQQSVPSINNAKSGIAIFQCESCGKSGMTQVDEVTEGETQIRCPECQQPARAMVKPLAGLMMGERQVPTYDIVDEIISFFNFTADVYNAKVGGIQTMNWLQIQKLRDRIWMQTHYPHLSFTSPANWSYPLRCDYALARGRWQYFNQQPAESGSGLGHEKYEVKDIYLHEDAYSSYRAPKDFEFVDAKGKRTFRIKEGQSIAEAQKRLYGENQHGFKFVWNEDRLLGICGPEHEELNFRDRFADVHWSRESYYLSSPNYSVVFIQDDMTLLNTLDHNITARNVVNPVFYDSTVFEQGDFSKEFIGTKNSMMLDPTTSLRDKVVSLPIPVVSPHLMQRMQWLWEIKDSVTLQTSAMRGESAKGEPFAKARQDLETSYGNLTSVLKSFAQCKNTTFLNKAGLAKKIWTLEQFQRVGSMFGELWTEEDIEEMCEIDFKRDLIVSYREGSEMPSTPMSKELKFFGALQQLSGAINGLPPEVAMQIVTPDKWAAIIEQLGEFGGFDFDVSGLEVDEVISQKRFISLAKLCEPFKGTTFEQIQQMKQQVVAYQPPDEQTVAEAQQLAQTDPQQAQMMMQPHPITAFDLKAEEIIGQSEIRFSEYEDLDQQQKFFVEQLRTEIGKEEPNEVLIAMLETLLGALGQRIDAVQQEAAAKDPQLQLMQKEQEQKDKDHAADMASKAADAQLNDKKLELEDKKIQLETKKVEIAAHQADRDALLSVMTQQADHEHENSQVAPVEENEEVIDKIAIPYDKVPPKAQQAILANAGIGVSKTDLEKTSKELNKPKPVTGTKPASKKK